MESKAMYHSIQLLRALAAWIIVFHHIGFDLIHHQRDINLFWVFFAANGSVGVDIFFIISGFVMALNAERANARAYFFWLRRLIRIVPNYWFYTLLTSLLILLLPSGVYHTTGFAIENLLLSLFFIPHANPSGYGNLPVLEIGWTLQFEMLFYSLFAVSLLLKAKFAPWLLCSLLLVLVALTSIAVDQSEFLGGHSILLIEFVMGIGLFKLSQRFPQYQSHPLTYAVTLLSLGFILSIWFVKGATGYSKLLLAGVLVLCFLLVEPYIKRENFLIKYLLHLGQISYSTYLAHFCLIGLFSAIYIHLSLETYSNLFGLLVIASTYFMSLFSWALIENGFAKRLLIKTITTQSQTMMRAR